MSYREAISAVVYQGSEFLLTNTQGWDEDILCFPQGGVEEGESDRQAVRRELHEELKTEQFEIVRQSDHIHTYEFDERKREGYTKQRQTIWFVEFTGDRSEIDVPNEEIHHIEWIDRNAVVPNLSFEEQKGTYRSVLNEWETSLQSKIHQK